MKTLETKNAPAAIGPYSQAKMVNNFVFASGQIPVDPATGEVAGDTIETQAEQSCKNVGAILAEAGLEFENVVKTTCFLADMADFAAFNAVYEKYFTSKPAPSEERSLRRRSNRCSRIIDVKGKKFQMLIELRELRSNKAIRRHQ